MINFKGNFFMSILVTMIIFMLNLNQNNFVIAKGRYSGSRYSSYRSYSYGYYGGGSTVIIGGPYGSVIQDLIIFVIIVTFLVIYYTLKSYGYIHDDQSEHSVH